VLVTGNYYLNISMGDVGAYVSPQMMEEVSITMDVDRLLPTFKISIKDATGLLGDIIPYDKNSNNIKIEFSRGENLNNLNIMNFMVKRRKPNSNKIYIIEGILSVKNLLTKSYGRAHTGNIKKNIELIASEDLEILNTEIGQSLNYDKTILQTRWTDAKLFRHLIDNIEGKNGELCYYCFIKNVKGKPILVFKSLSEILSSEPRYNFIVGPKPYENFYPVVDYKIFDNSPLISDLGARSQSFGYFNYNSGEYVDDSIVINDCPSLAKNFLVDKDNRNDSVYIHKLGRNNLFTSNFHGKNGGSFNRRINGFINMWISTWGLENVSPGDIIRLIFSESLVRGKLFLYQHSGLWMIKRVVHVFGSSYMTNLLLTRAGVNTDVPNTLIPATNIKRK